MVFLELPIPHPMSQRSPSQQNFVMEEDGSDYDNESRCENGKDNTSSTYSGSIFGSLWTRILIGSLCILSVLLTIALTIFVVLYVNTFEPFEICRTKSCTRTATLFMRTMDDTVDPCEDFQKFACGNWITDTATVVSVPVYDHTTIMRDRIIGRLRGLVENVTSNDIDILQQLKKMYRSCVSTETIEKSGLKPIANIIRNLIPKNQSVAKTLGMIRRLTGQSYIFDLEVSANYMDTSYNTIFIDQPETVVGKGDFQNTDNGTIVAYTDLINSTTYKLKQQFVDQVPIFGDMNNQVNTIVEYEQNFALSLTDDQYRSKPNMYNQLTVRQLNLIFSGQDEFGSDAVGTSTNFLMTPKRKRSAGRRFRTHLHFNWTEYLGTVFDGIVNIDENSTVIVNDLNYIHKVQGFLNHTNHYDIEMYLAWQIIYTFGKDVTQDFRSLFNSFSSKVSGAESVPNRRTECISLLDSTIPFALTHKYILKYVTSSIIDETKEMVDNIIKSFKTIVKDLDWMDANTKTRALLKVNNIRSFIGYPKWLSNPNAVERYYYGLKFTNSFFDNMVEMLKWLSGKKLSTVFKQVDSTWSSDKDSPAEADAFYDDELNAFTFPSGFLQEPFVGMGLRSVDYGALGSVIGHELTHGFDTEGRYCDEKGRLNSWWTMDTLTKFLGKAECFVNQYSNFRIPELAAQLGPNNTINGKQTLTENIADNGGIRESLQAYRYYIEKRGIPEPRLPGLEKYTPEQIFFLSFAQSWCSYMNPNSLLDLVETNVHSPSRFRIIGPLSNFKEFSETWKCKSGTGMNPEKKCVLWG